MQNHEVRAIVDRMQTHVRNRTQFQPYRVDNRPLTLAEAYAIQSELVARALSAGPDRIAGYKIGLTGKAMQKFCGVNEPVVGRILASGVHPSGATLKTSDFQRLGIESELALRVREFPVIRPDTQVGDLLACVDAVAAAFEVVDDRDADYARLEAVSIIAENSWNAGMVFGEPVSATHLGDLRDLEGRLFIDGELVATGTSSDVMTGPLSVLAWLSQFAREMGYELQPGQWIMTGSIIPTKFAAPGQSYAFQLGTLPPVTVAIS